MNETNSSAVTGQAQPPEAPADDTSADHPAVAGSGPAPSRAPLAIALVALILAVGLAVAAYFIWFQVQHLSREQATVQDGVNDRIAPLRKSIDGLGQTLADNRAALQARVGKLDEELQSVSQRVSTVAAIMGRSEQGWALAEVEYLLRIASQRLQLQRDTGTAEKALEAADARLRELADPHYLNVREQIAGDLEAVKAVPSVDIDGLSVTLSSAMERIDGLPVAGTHYEPATASDKNQTEAPTTAGSIDELGQVVWGSLSGLFRLREHDKPVGPMLSPEHEYFLRENLRLQLATARMALLRNDQAQYREALQTAGQWLREYFDMSDKGVAQMQSRLESMAATDIRPALPDISGSLRLLRQQMRLSEQQAVLPVVPDKPADPGDRSKDNGTPK
jgi:uroporphyrin-3 C-methyltransferase